MNPQTEEFTVERLIRDLEHYDALISYVEYGRYNIDRWYGEPRVPPMVLHVTDAQLARRIKGSSNEVSERYYWELIDHIDEAISSTREVQAIVVDGETLTVLTPHSK